MRMKIDPEDVDWLSTLLAAFKEQYKEELDADPSATLEMLHRCGRVIPILKQAFPMRDRLEDVNWGNASEAELPY
jgi:hypothetical protein